MKVFLSAARHNEWEHRQGISHTRTGISVSLNELLLVPSKHCAVRLFWSVRKIAKSDYSLRHVCPSICQSVRPHGTTRLPLDRFSLNLIFEYFSKICREDRSFIKIWQELRVFTYTFVIVSRSVLLTMKNISQKTRWKNQNTVCSIRVFFFSENRSVYEIMLENTVEPDTPQVAEW